MLDREFDFDPRNIPKIGPKNAIFSILLKKKKNFRKKNFEKKIFEKKNFLKIDFPKKNFRKKFSKKKFLKIDFREKKIFPDPGRKMSKMQKSPKYQIFARNAKIAEFWPKSAFLGAICRFSQKSRKNFFFENRFFGL